MTSRTIPDSSSFTSLREMLFPDQDLRYWVLDHRSDHDELRVAQESIRAGKLHEGRKVLNSLRSYLRDSMLYWYTVAYVESLSGNARAARKALRRVLSLPGDESRAILQTWKLLRDFGEEPSRRLASHVYGVVFEIADKVKEQYTVLAGYGDGQLRWHRHPGPSLIGENWTESERKAAKQLVEFGQLALSHVPMLQAERDLPAPGAAHVYLLTPGGTYRARGTVEELAAILFI